MIYLGNAFSAGMLDQGDLVVRFTRCQPHDVPAEAVSCVGHADTALLLSTILGRDVPMQRVSTSLKDGDVLYVAQYNGPRLPEGATSLPEGATLRWFKCSVRRPLVVFIEGGKLTLSEPEHEPEDRETLLVVEA